MTDAQPTVEVLLATYQGARYLTEQVDSVLSQTGVRVHVTARDDGSTDSTAALLQALAARHGERLRVLPSVTPTGSATGNFRLLLQSSCAPYVALADQDDVWSPTKLNRSLRAMQALEREFGAETPLLVFTDLAVVDAALQPVAPSLWRQNGLAPGNVRRLGRLLGENVVTGCTALLNRPLAALAARMPVPPTGDPLAIQHDHWIALLACTLGQAAWLPEPTVQYRQHGGNVLGADVRGSRMERLFSASAVQARRSARRRMQAQATTFLESYRDQLSPRQAQTLEAYTTLETRPCRMQCTAMVRHGLWRSTLAKNLLSIADLLR